MRLVREGPGRWGRQRASGVPTSGASAADERIWMSSGCGSAAAASCERSGGRDLSLYVSDGTSWRRCGACVRAVRVRVACLVHGRTAEGFLAAAGACAACALLR
eukprot:6990273-Prymnesium_polylepis.1